MKRYKIWAELTIEEYDDETDTHQDIGWPVTIQIEPETTLEKAKERLADIDRNGTIL